MKANRFFRLTGLLLTLVFAVMIWKSADAEPWISNRFAQNCAACHAPGRINQEPKDRRCTLSCQGCHVNPNGGGMRNRYGVWNQERWLRSLRSSFMKDKGSPAPLQKQKYWSKKAHAYSAYMGKDIKKDKEKEALKKINKGVRKSKQREIARKIPDHQETLTIKQVDPPSEYYDQYSNLDWRTITAKNQDEFRLRIPKDDPYREERELDIYAGGDIRYLYGKWDRELSSGASASTDLSFLMGVDLGVRIRPIEYHQLSFVIESRFLNGYKNSDIEDGFINGAQIRSSYVLVDDLPWNTYAQVGLYRPMFGHYNPDHTALAQELSGFDKESVYKVFGFGLAPNVPFLIVNVIEPMGNTNFSQDKGFVIAAGGRFVTLGASTKLSYWSTEDEKNNLSKNMYSFTMGGNIGNYILNAELLRIEREQTGIQSDKGNVYTLENKYRFWRENYIVLNYAFSNTDKNLRAGSASDLMAGVKSFLTNGVEIEALYVKKEDLSEDTGVDTTDNIVQVQAHLFF